MKRIALLLGTIFLSCTHRIPVQNVQIDHTYDRKQYEAFGKKFVIATQGEAATTAAKQIIDEGGNLFDAAVAASFVIAVERPQSTGLGGGGFMMLYSAKEKKTYAIDFREVAPLAATETMFQDLHGNVIPGKSTTGIFSVAIPTLVAGLFHIHQKFGKLPWEKILQPAIDLAENGLKIYPHLSDSLQEQEADLIKSTEATSIFFNSDGRVKKLGDQLIQKDLAKTLREIQAKGAAGFYDGWVKEAILRESKKYHGLFQEADFHQDFVKYREPIIGSYQNFYVASMPPPSSGGTHVIEILKIIDPLDVAKFGHYNPKTIHYVSAAMQAAYADRFKYMGDPDFSQIPIDEVLSNKHTTEIRKKFQWKEKAVPSKDYEIPEQRVRHESPETTHFSMMDVDGDTVATTQTINGHFGSQIVVEGTGIVLNDEMDDFAAKVGVPNMVGLIGGDKNVIRPSKRPLSSMSPTILFDWKHRPVMALGTPDGSNIINCVVQVLLNYIEFRMPLFDAVQAMRYHHQWYPEEIKVELPGFSPETTSALEDMGYKVNLKKMGCKVEAVTKEGSTLHAVSDIRGEGMSLGE